MSSIYSLTFKAAEPTFQESLEINKYWKELLVNFSSKWEAEKGNMLRIHIACLLD